MATPNDQAVLQAIFNPNTPFGDVGGLDLGDDTEQEEADEGEYLTLEGDSPRGIPATGSRQTGSHS